MQSKHFILFILICSISFICKSQNTKKYINPFDTLKYDKVVAFDYDGTGDMQIVMQGRVFDVAHKVSQKKELTKEQISSLTKTLGDTKTYGGTTAACFDPHFGVVYYRQNKIVGYISICLGCNFLESLPAIAAQNSHKSDVCDECYFYGFSKSGRKNISDLVKALQFSHWELGSIFDE